MGVDGIVNVTKKCGNEGKNYVWDGIKNKASQAADAVRDLFK
jgi:hypothetical protein